MLAPLLAATVVVVGAWSARPLGVRVPGSGSTALGDVGLEPPSWFVDRAAAADLTAIDRWWRLALAAPLVVGASAAVLGGAGAGVAGVLATVTAEAVALRLASGRADARLARSVPDALDAVARSCRAGSSVVSSLGSLGPADGPAGAVFAEVARRVERGVSLGAALDDVVDTHREPSVRLAAAALLVGAETGAAPARAVEGVAATLRDRAALEREAAGHATQATASAAVLVVAPVGFGVVAIVTDPRVGGFLFGSPIGWACLVAGVVLDVVGAWWMSCMVKAAR